MKLNIMKNPKYSTKGYRLILRRANKEHECIYCSRKIGWNRIYIYESGIAHDGPFSNKMHISCYVRRKWMCASCSGTCCNDVVECFKVNGFADRCPKDLTAEDTILLSAEHWDLIKKSARNYLAKKKSLCAELMGFSRWNSTITFCFCCEYIGGKKGNCTKCPALDLWLNGKNPVDTGLAGTFCVHWDSPYRKKEITKIADWFYTKAKKIIERTKS